MPHVQKLLCAGVPLALAGLAHAQTIDFETLPGGAVPADQLIIDTQYGAQFGVSFSLVDRTSGAVIGAPRIARPGAPQTAFASCLGADTPHPGQGLGDSFLTDSTSIGVAGDLRIDYANPVAAATGVIVDTDCRSPNGSLPCEQWTIEALDDTGAVIDTYIIDGPLAPSSGPCADPNGFGDARAIGWFFSRGQADIHAVLIRYTGAATSVGLAFDNFSVSSEPGPIVIDAPAPDGAYCWGDLFIIDADASGGLPPYTYEWTFTPTGGVGEVVGTDPALTASVYADGEYTLTVTDSLGSMGMTPAFAVSVSDSVYRVSQESAPGAGDFNANVLGDVRAHQTPQTLFDYYGFSASGDPFTGVFPALTVNRAHSFLVGGLDGLGYFTVFSGPGSAAGRAETRTVFDEPEAGAGWVTQDDGSDTYNISATFDVFRARHSWSAGFTDGFSIGPIDGPFGLVSGFSDEFSGTPTFSGITSWALYDATPMAPALPLALVEGQRIRIERVCALDCAADLTSTGATLPGQDGFSEPDGTVDFDDLGYFLAAWLATDGAIADLTTTGATLPGQAGFAVPDGVVGFDDLGYYLSLWVAGCP